MRIHIHTYDAFVEAKHPRSTGGQFTAGENARPRTPEEHKAQSVWHEQEGQRREQSAKTFAQKGRHGLAGEEREKAAVHFGDSTYHQKMSEQRNPHDYKV
jgi:hypothetical protein